MPFLTDSNPPAYNGYTFPTSVETTQFTAAPQQDEANRTILFVRYQITLQWEVIAALNDNIDSTMASIRRLLMQRGGAFTYNNRGFGADWDIGSSFYDVQGGPIPLSFDFKPKGKNQGATCTWTVEICVPTQCAAIVYSGVPMAFNYKIRFRIDRHGFTTRTYSGHLAVPKIVGDGLTIADTYLDQVIPTIPIMFERVDRDYDHSLDSKRVDFMVQDQQLAITALPAFCTAASASHFIRSTERGLLKWQGVIQGNYSVIDYCNRDLAWNAFHRIVKARLNYARQNLTLDVDGEENVDQQKPKEKGLIIITGYEVGEPEIYGTNNASFSIMYEATCSLKAIIGNEILSGHFRYPILGQNAWQEWADSMVEVHDPRGIARLAINPTDEVIVDLCATDTAAPPTQEADFGGGSPGFNLESILELQPEPDSESSWFLFEPEIEVYEDSHAVVSSSLTEEAFSPYTQSPGDLSAQGYVPDVKPTEPTDQVQYRSPSTLYIYLAGKAERAWFKIPRPKIVSWNGLQVKNVSTIDDGCYWRQKNVGNLGIGLPIYYAEWRFKYAVEDRPVQPIAPPTTRSDEIL